MVFPPAVEDRNEMDWLDGRVVAFRIMQVYGERDM